MMWQLDDNYSPVCVLMWACKDFSLGNTRLHILHWMELSVWFPCCIKVVTTVAFGLPLFIKSFAESGDPKGMDIGESGELPAELGLRISTEWFRWRLPGVLSHAPFMHPLLIKGLEVQYVNCVCLTGDRNKLSPDDILNQFKFFKSF